jgi:Type II secretion system (T2SS), protein E, N-terminal domain
MTPLPTLDPVLIAAETFEWPQPPFARRQTMAPLPEGWQPCRIESMEGTTVDAELSTFDLDGAQIRIRIGAGEPLDLPFTRFRHLTLTLPWPLARPAPDMPLERVPAAAQERDWCVELRGGGTLSGRTMGHVHHAQGLFLFTPGDDGRSVVRSFVPEAAIDTLVMGKSVEERAVERWVSTPAQLIAAIDAQRHAPIAWLGDALLELGFVTRGQIEQALREQGPEREQPLGELLVARGYLMREDLQTALAHKMGYPVVDLTRFPIDVAAARRLSARAMLEHRALPVMQHGQRLVVVVDDLARIAPLQTLRGLAGLQVVPALAPRGRLSLVLANLSQRLGSDVWASNVPLKHKSGAALAL